ncbi:MAG TPA: hypothetical protein VGN32_00740 [Ktedonobacterales bacterium]|jgi:hypothetical protein|nr:hypothetical protein [Ktedonobacterales bacterium]
MRILGHLVSTTFHALGRMLVAGVLCAALAAGVTLLVAYTVTRQWPPTPLTEAAAIALAVLAAYASGLTVLFSASVRALVGAARAVEKEAVAPIKAVEHELEGQAR